MDMLTPSQAFLNLWNIAKQWDAPSLSLVQAPSDSYLSDLKDLLEGDVVDLNSFLGPQLKVGPSPTKLERGKILAALREIDLMFYRIHPRTKAPAPSAAARARIPLWLELARDSRRRTLDYAADTNSRLIPRGPLTRSAREDDAYSAESLADRFAALSVVARQYSHKGRPISISHLAVGPDDARGIPPGKNLGKEKILFVPVAENPGEVEASVIELNGKQFLDFNLRKDIQAAERILTALRTEGAVDIAVAPEFVVSVSEEAQLVEALRKTCLTTAGLIIAGSGKVEPGVDGLPWNEARAVNGIGAKLWTQRKIWPSAPTRERAEAYAEALADQPIFPEFSAAGDSIVIADTASLGRCVILICQDVHMLPLTSELVSDFQPDWVFMPILDPEIKSGGWAKQRLFELSGLAHSRFVAFTSVGLKLKGASSQNEVICGLAVGPKAQTDEDNGRDSCEVKLSRSATKQELSISWRTKGNWKKTELS